MENRAAYEAVKEGRLWVYGIDETWGHPDFALDGVNAIVSPHVGSETHRGKERMQCMTAKTVTTYPRGKTPELVVNR